MANPSTADEVMRFARALSPSEKLRLIEQLAPDVNQALSPGPVSPPIDPDDQYERGYQNVPEEVTDLEALLPHLPLPRERW
jgi:hypothetical protein